MGASLKAIKRRINSTRKTQQITNAMQMVSTVKLNKIQKHTITYQIYVSKIQEVIYHLTKSHLLDSVAYANETSDNSKLDALSMLQKRDIKNIGILVITSDRGLVGSYNSIVLKNTMSLINNLKISSKNIKIIAIGRTGLDFFRQRNYEIIYNYCGISDIPKFKEVYPVIKAVVSMYKNSVYDKLYVCHNHFINTLNSEFRINDMLPITQNSINSFNINAKKKEKNNKKLVYRAEPSDYEVLDMILPQYIESLIYGTLLDAKTAEHASSSIAMKSASDNANDLISSLQLEYNRARQSAITTEITEITGAITALK